jgi:hypothetical protein
LRKEFNADAEFVTFEESVMLDAVEVSVQKIQRHARQS